MSDPIPYELIFEPIWLFPWLLLYYFVALYILKNLSIIMGITVKSYKRITIVLVIILYFFRTLTEVIGSPLLPTLALEFTIVTIILGYFCNYFSIRSNLVIVFSVVASIVLIIGSYFMWVFLGIFLADYN
ncbi:MAG: hypothetical protein KGZ63_04385 [Clostridiales bacterium]|jgi:hypothetical protein|nr:hypothetical protein [Clostridiales bacterium]